MRGLKMSWFYLIFFLSFIIGNLEASRHHEKKRPSAVVVGTVYCDTCFQDDFSKSSHFISGASVAVECKDENSKPSFRQEVKTDEHGGFKVHLPFSVSKHVRRINRCSVKLINSSEPYCAVASTATSSSLHLKKKKPGIHIFSAGFFTFKPLKQPNLCNQKPGLENSKEQKTSGPLYENPSIFPPPIQDPTTPYLFPLPGLPNLPPLPQLPPLPGLPYLPPLPGNAQETEPEKHTRDTKPSGKNVDHPEFFPPLPPNPLLPPPILPPNPLQPPPNPLQPLLPPNPLLSPPLPLIPLPPIPGLTPAPAPPTFPFPLPPFPPRFPGTPPASSSSTEKPSP